MKSQSIELNNIACETDNLKWVKLTSDGIDSGTAGFYDYDYIQNTKVTNKYNIIIYNQTALCYIIKERGWIVWMRLQSIYK